MTARPLSWDMKSALAAAPLIRTCHGYARNSPRGDPLDTWRGATINALARRGLLSLDDNGRAVKPQPQPQPGETP